MSVYLQAPHPKRRTGQSFSNRGLKITYIVWEWTSSLSGSVNRRINREWQRFSLSNMKRKKGSKRIEMIIKMVNEFKLTIVHFARANPMQICACAWIYRWTRKNVEKNQDTGPPGRRAARPLGLRTAGPSRVVGNLVPRSPTATFQCKTEWDLGTRLGSWAAGQRCMKPFGK